MADTLRDRAAAAFDVWYDIEAEIGRGGMGVVYRAQDRKLRRHVAIKLLPPDLAFRDEIKTRFLREAETAAQLSHPNIVPIYSVEEREGLVCIVMALVDGESVGQRLARERRPALADVRRILRDVADALAYAHGRGIVHRDIKPDNILLDRLSGRPMVTDFGIARAVEGDSRLTVTGIAVGTPAYMSPEQAMGEREIDGRSDLYSLSVVGFQMITGELPFQASNTPSMLMKHLSERPRAITALRPDAPAALAAVIERGLAKKPADRFSDAAEFRDALIAAEQGVAPFTRAAPEPTPDHLSGAWKRPAANLDASHDGPHGADMARGRLGVVGRLANPDRTADERERRAREEYENHRRAELDAVEASNIGMRPPGSLPPIPAFMPATWREARNEWRTNRRQWREGRRMLSDGVAGLEPRSEEDRIRAFRRRTASTVVTIGVLATINMLTGPNQPWFIFPTAFMSLGLLRGAAKLWADGISFKRVFGRAARQELAKGTTTPALPVKSLGDLAAKLAPADVLAGAWGDIIRRAAADRAAVHDAIGKLAPADRNLIPDVGPTVDALAERVGSIAQALHRMDEDITPAQIADLDRRVAATRAQPESAERDQRLQLLERQQVTLADLGRRRETLQTQIESASLMLQNMRLDLLALRSVGVQSAIDDVSGATQEARALSKEIANVLDAAREIR